MMRVFISLYENNAQTGQKILIFFLIFFAFIIYLPIVQINHGKNFVVNVKQNIVQFNVKPDNPDSTCYHIPLKRAGRLFLMDAVIDGDTGNLVFDSGATSLVLNKTYFRNHVSSGAQYSKGITSSIGNVEMVTVDHLSVSGLEFSKVQAGLANLGHIENKRDVKIIGLFGFALIKHFQIVLDFKRNELILSPMDKKGYTLTPNNYEKITDDVQKIEISNNAVIVKGTVGGKSLRFCIDTGAEINVLNSDSPKSVLETVTITRSSKLYGAGSSRPEVFYGIMNDFWMGSKKLPKMETVITYVDNLREVYASQIDGVLGYDFLLRGRFCINFEKKTLHIYYYKPGEK